MKAMSVEDFRLMCQYTGLVRVAVFKTPDSIAVSAYVYLIYRNCLYLITVMWDGNGPADISVELRANAGTIDRFVADRITIWSASPYASGWVLPIWSHGTIVFYHTSSVEKELEESILLRIFREIGHASMTLASRRSILRHCAAILQRK